jgi:hypothetical protein
MILMQAGLPTYIYSNEGNDGLVAMLYRHNLVEPGPLFRAVERVVDNRITLEQALVMSLHAHNIPDPENTAWRYIAGLLLRRLNIAFNWRDGRYRAWTVLASESPFAKPIPSLLGSLVSGVRRAYTREELLGLVQHLGGRAVVLSQQRESHIAALALKPATQAMAQAIDGARSLPSLLKLFEGSKPEEQHEIYALLYVLEQTRIAEFI